MKRTIMLIIPVCISIATFAGNGHVSDEIAFLSSLRPLTTMNSDVKQFLGEPTRIEKSEKQVLWTYRDNSRDLLFYWDAASGKLQKYTFTGSPHSDNEWNKEKAGILAAVEVSFTDIIHSLGDPNGIIVSGHEQKLYYAFSGNMVTLNFYDGTLMQYSVNYSGKHKK